MKLKLVQDLMKQHEFWEDTSKIVDALQRLNTLSQATNPDNS